MKKGVIIYRAETKKYTSWVLTPEKFSIRTELLGVVYALYKFRVYVFGHNFYNPETINKYCCIHVP